MKLLVYARVYFGLPFRQTEGMICAYCNRIPAVFDFTSIHKRVNKMNIKINDSTNDSDDEIILAIDRSIVQRKCNQGSSQWCI